MTVYTWVYLLQIMVIFIGWVTVIPAVSTFGSQPLLGQ